MSHSSDSESDNEGDDEPGGDSVSLNISQKIARLRDYAYDVLFLTDAEIAMANGVPDFDLYSVQDLHPTARLWHHILTSEVNRMPKDHILHQLPLCAIKMFLWRHDPHGEETPEYPAVVKQFLETALSKLSRSAFKFFRGPHGANKDGEPPSWEEVNLFFTSLTTMDGWKVGHSPRPGVFKGLLRAAMRFASARDIHLGRLAGVDAKLRLQPGGFSVDGMAIQLGVSLDRAHDELVGLDLPNPVRIANIRQGDELNLDTPYFTDAGALIWTSFDKSNRLPLAQQAMRTSTGPARRAQLCRDADLVNTCERCVLHHTHPVSPYGLITDPLFCRTDDCDACNRATVNWGQRLIRWIEDPAGLDGPPAPPDACLACQAHGNHVSAVPAFRRCARCARSDQECVRQQSFFVTMDCEASQRAAIREHYEMLRAGTLEARYVHLAFLPDGTHIVKNIRGALFSHSVFLRGQIVALRHQLTAIFDDPMYHNDLVDMGVTQKAVELTSLQHQDVASVRQVTLMAPIIRLSKSIATQVLPEPGSWGPTPDDIGGAVVAVCTGLHNRQIFVATSTTVYRAVASTPWKLVTLREKLQGVTSLAFAQGLLFVACQKSILFLEVKPGSISTNYSAIPATFLSTQARRDSVGADELVGLNATGIRYVLACKARGKPRGRILPGMMTAPRVQREMARLGDTKGPWQAAKSNVTSLRELMLVTSEEDADAKEVVKPKASRFEPLTLAPGVACATFESQATAMSAVQLPGGGFRLDCITQPTSGGRQVVRVLTCALRGGTLVVTDVTNIALPTTQSMWTDLCSTKASAVVCSPTHGLVTVDIASCGVSLLADAEATLGPVGIDRNDTNALFVTCDWPDFCGVAAVEITGRSVSVRKLMGQAKRRSPQGNGTGGLGTASFLKPGKLAWLGLDTVLFTDAWRLMQITPSESAAVVLETLGDFAVALGMRKRDGERAAPSKTLAHVVTAVTPMLAVFDEMHAEGIAATGRPEGQTTMGRDMCMPHQTSGNTKLFRFGLVYVSHVAANWVAEINPRSLLQDCNENFHARMRRVY